MTNFSHATITSDWESNNADVTIRPHTMAAMEALDFGNFATAATYKRLEGIKRVAMLVAAGLSVEHVQQAI